MKLHDNSQRSSRLAVTQPTARADRPVRAPAHAVAFSTGVAAGYDRNGPGSRPATNCAQNPPPALAAIQTHCCSDHRHAWRCNADPDVDLEKSWSRHPRPRERRRMTRGRRGSPTLRRVTLSFTTTLPVCAGAQEARMILKEPHARAAWAGVNPDESHAARVTN